MKPDGAEALSTRLLCFLEGMAMLKRKTSNKKSGNTKDTGKSFGG